MRSIHPVGVAFFFVLSAAAAQAQVNPMVIEHDVTVGLMPSDRFTWQDSQNKPRVAVLAHNDPAVAADAGLFPGPGGAYGGALREFRYQLPDASTRIANVTTYGNGGNVGFGYVVNHSNAGSCIGDDSPLGGYYAGHWARIFEGRHHAIFRFTQNYPRNCPTVARTLPVTIDWIFSTGRDNPVYAITYDVDLAGPSGGADVLNDDSRAPYGELNIDGDGSTNIDGVAWGDRNKFTNTSSPVSLSSSWTYNVANTVPYVKLWIAGPLAAGKKDATMGIVQTQTMTQQDGGGARDPNYHDITALWNTTSATGNGYCPTYTMPCQDEWAYQANADSIGIGIPNNNARLTWRTQWGFIGQTTYLANDGTGATPKGYPKKSYSTYIVLGTHSSAPVEAQLTQVETMQSVTMTTSLGSVVTTGPAGVTRADNVTYAPAGYNHVYGALAFSASSNRVDATVTVGAGTLTKPLIIVSNYSGGNPGVVRLGGTALTADVDYFASPRAAANELWITLNHDFPAGSNHVQIMATATSPSAPMIDHATPGNGQANIFFGAPATDGGSSILNYNASCTPGVHSMSGAGSPITVGGLTNGTLYTCSVTATNGVGTSVASGTVAVTPGAAVAHGDFDGDGKSDLVWRNDSSGSNYLWKMNGTSLAAATPIADVTDTTWKIVGSGDFNAGGKAGLLWRRTTTGENYLWIMNGAMLTSALPLPTVSDSNWVVVAVGDFDGDGKADIFWRHSVTGENYMWLMNGGTLLSATRMPAVPDTNWKVVGCGDLDGDGKSDLVWRRDVSGENYVWILNGTSLTAAAAISSVGDANWKIVAVGDFDGDGKADLFWRNAASGDDYVWRMNGATILAVTPSTPVGDLNWKVVGVGDFDGDGKTDLFWRRDGTGADYVWLMNGANPSLASSISAVTDTNWKVAAPR